MENISQAIGQLKEFLELGHAAIDMQFTLERYGILPKLAEIAPADVSLQPPGAIPAAAMICPAEIAPADVTFQEENHNGRKPAFRRAHRAEDVAGRTEKLCNGSCGHVKPLSAFPTSKSCADGHEGICKACRNERNRKRSAAAAQSSPPAAPVPAAYKAPVVLPPLKYRCEPCHTNFLTKESLANHNCLNRKAEAVEEEF